MKQTKILIIAIAGILIVSVVWIVKICVSPNSSIQEDIPLRMDSKEKGLADYQAQTAQKAEKARNDSLQDITDATVEDIKRLQEATRLQQIQDSIRTAEMTRQQLQPQPKELTPEELYAQAQVKADSIMRAKTATPKTKKKKSQSEADKPKDEKVDESVEPKTTGFNTVVLDKTKKSNAIKAYVHSTQTVMIGSTLKMRTGENATTDTGVLIPKNSPIYGTVKAIDGERVIIEITTININGNILPFEKTVFSSDAIEGIYVPGNEKSDMYKDATSGAVDGTNVPVTAGNNLGTSIAVGATNGVINATKQATSKSIKRVKVTIKTNYTVLLMDDKKTKKNENEEEEAENEE